MAQKLMIGECEEGFIKLKERANERGGHSRQVTVVCRMFPTESCVWTLVAPAARWDELSGRVKLVHGYVFLAQYRLSDKLCCPDPRPGLIITSPCKPRPLAFAIPRVLNGGSSEGCTKLELVDRSRNLTLPREGQRKLQCTLGTW